MFTKPTIPKANEQYIYTNTMNMKKPNTFFFHLDETKCILRSNAYLFYDKRILYSTPRNNKLIKINIKYTKNLVPAQEYEPISILFICVASTYFFTTILFYISLYSTVNLNESGAFANGLIPSKTNLFACISLTTRYPSYAFNCCVN